MTLGIPVRRWRAAFAFACMLALALAAAQAQQPPAAAQQGYLGVELHSLSRGEAQKLGSPASGGVAVIKTDADSPAAAAGLKSGDVLLQIDGKPVASAEQVLKAVAGKAPGEAIKVRLLRQGKLRAGPVKLGAKPDAAKAAGARAGEPAPAFAAAMEAAAEEKLPVEVVPQLGHSRDVSSVAIAPDGKTALSGSWDKTLRLWDLASGREIRKFEGHSAPVISVAIAPDGKTALSDSDDETLRLWDLASGREIKKIEGHSGAFAIAPDGKTVLSGSSDKTLRLWDLASGREIKRFEGHSDWVNSVAFAPNGKAALSGSSDKTLRLWDLASGREIKTFEGHSKGVRSVAFAPDGKTALSGSEDRTLRLWDLASGREIAKFEGHSGDVYSVAFSPDGKTALSGGWDYALRLWDLASRREIKTFEGHSERVKSVAIAPDGKTALSGGSDKTLTLWDLASGREIKTFEGHSAPVASVAIALDGKTALSGSADMMLRLWDLASGREIRKFEGHSGVVFSVSFAPDGKTALSGSGDLADGGDNTVRLWDLASGRELRKFEGHLDAVNSVAISPDGKTALSGSGDKTLRLWDLASGREIRKFEGHSGWVTSVAIAPDGKTALSGSHDMTLRLWDLASGREIRKFEGHSSFVNSVAIAPDGKTALSGGGIGSGSGEFKLWDLASGEEIRNFEGHLDPVNSVAISPDGKTALSGRGDNTLRLRDLASGRGLKKFVGHSGPVWSVAFAPGGKTALSGSNDGTIRFWDLQRGEALASLLALPDGNQLAITPKGFFTASQRDTDMLAIVRGFEVTTIGQVHQSLFNPDLVREALAGDPDGEVKRAAEVINLDKVLDAGPPPAAVVTSHEPGSHSGQDLVTVAARVSDGGKGIGRIEWRLNGVTAGVMSAPAGPGPDYEVTQELAFDPGENRIEVIAYEGRNLLASLPAQTTIVYDGPADTAKPKLHILAIGINAYEDKGWAEPGSERGQSLSAARPCGWRRQGLRGRDGKGRRGALWRGAHQDRLDGEPRPANLDRIVREMAAEISPRDTFVLYAAAHGYSLNGHFYMIPQDYQGGTDPEALEARAIGQDQLAGLDRQPHQGEEGADPARHLRVRRADRRLYEIARGCAGLGSRGWAPARSDRAAGADGGGGGQARLRGLQGPWRVHLRADGGAAQGRHQQQRQDRADRACRACAKARARAGGGVGEHGGVVKGAAVVAMRGAEGDKQSAHFGSTGEDFAVVARLPYNLCPRHSPLPHAPLSSFRIGS